MLQKFMTCQVSYRTSMLFDSWNNGRRKHKFSRGTLLLIYHCHEIKLTYRSSLFVHCILSCMFTFVFVFLQVAIKIIDKTQLNPSSLQKVRNFSVLQWWRYYLWQLFFCSGIFINVWWMRIWVVFLLVTHMIYQCVSWDQQLKNMLMYIYLYSTVW